MGRGAQERGASGELAAIGKLLAALVEALVRGRPDEIVTIAKSLEEHAHAAVGTDADPALVSALMTLRERAALLTQTLFATTDRFLGDAVRMQERVQGYRPGQFAGSHGMGAHGRVETSDGIVGVAGYRNGIADLRA
ncbi:MAG: hypothetical protein NZL87_00910 [Thermomicrobium sp.]|nr:hypothetical protein [Thermomicrobium sp.]